MRDGANYLEPKDSDVYQLITTKPGERKKQE